MNVSRSYKLDSIDELEAAVQDAHDDWRRGNYASSFQKYLAIVGGRLAIAAEARLPVGVVFGPADLIVIERLSDLARLFGHLKASSKLLEAIRLLSIESGNFYLADSLLLKRIDLLLGFGKVDESRELLELMHSRIGNVDEIKFDKRGLSEWESSCDWPSAQLQERRLIFSLLYLAMGRILYGYGQYGDAAASFNRGIAHSKRFKTDISDHLEIQLALGLAAAWLDMGDLPAAENMLLELELRVRSAKDPWPLVRWLELSAKVDQLCGRLSQAKNALTDVYRICHQYKFYQAELGAALNFAHLLILMNQTLRANHILQQINKIAERIGERDQAARSGFLLEILHARMRSLVDGVPIAPNVMAMQGGEEIQQPAEAAPIVVTDIPETDNYLARFEDRVLEFHRYLGNSDLKRAALLEATTRAAFQLSDSSLIRVRLEVLKATLCYYQADLEQAETLFTAAVPQLRELGLVHELWQAQRFLTWCRIRLNRPEQEIRELTEQTQELLNQMSDQMPSKDQTLFLLNKWTTEEEFIAGRINQLSKLQEEIASLPFHSRWRRRFQLMSQLDELCLHLENYKRKQAQRVVQANEEVPVAEKPQSFWRRLWNHSPRRCSIQFLVLPDRLLVIRRGWLSLDFGVSSVTRLQLRQLIRNWHTLIVMRIGRTTLNRNLSPKAAGVRNLSSHNEKQIAKQCEQLGDELAKILQLPRLMKGLPRRVKALSFLPDDVLHGLAFAALRCDGRYLIEKFAVSTFVEREMAPAVKSDGKHALLVHVARGNGREGLSELPGTRRETKALGDLLAGKGVDVETLGDDQTTKPAILAGLPKCSLFHIACHGTFVRNRADLSGLILLPADNKRDLLSFVDLSKLDLTGVQHATLSSCWSADNFILPGRWIISLPEALNRAGVGSVLASFWKVDDQFAISFMTRFFQYLDKHPRDQALRRTQLDCLNRTLIDAGSGIDTSDPLYWANYTLHGEHKKLKLPR